MSNFYSNLTSVATQLLDKFGGPVKVIGSNGTKSTKGVVLGLSKADRDGQYSSTANCVIYLPGNITVDVGHTIVSDKINYVVVGSEIIAPDGSQNVVRKAYVSS